MNNLIIVILFCAVLSFSACEQADIAKNSSNINNPNAAKNSNVATEKQVESDTERHLKVKSENNFADSYANLKKAIESNKLISIIAELDHSDNAGKAGMELRPTKIIMFGNPQLGTPLMKANQAIGLDLPQKMLVYEDESGNVFVSYNNPKVLAENHGITGQDEVLDKISATLKGLAEAGTKKAMN